ncbi:unnamed protein product [Dovyalis caffra]|uniref:PGG domain-containing protein n=1 Tax=Dovyalis caffra TaxID=77055 RepID=A0AAV1SEI2_9ROSI|nr:unnamed protein product [Dovyalis caffra]
MELSVNIVGQSSSPRDEMFQKCKADCFLPGLHVPGDTEPKEMMDEKLYKYAKEDRYAELFYELHSVSSAKPSSIIYRQVGPSGNSLLHVAASHGSKGVTELLLHHFPSLITTKNFQDDTALHLAARAGQPETASILINKAKNHGEANNFVTFMETKNDRGNTALHDAVINCHDNVAHFLVSQHFELSYMENNEHKSPLYLAVENVTDEQSYDKMLAILMHAIPDEVDLLKKLEGKSPVHAAVEGRKKNILAQIGNEKPDLLRQKDEKNANALHCAASMGCVLATQFLIDKYRDGAIEQNSEGNLPIHVASKKGHDDVVGIYISKWTDPKEFLNSKGQNILHVAAESGRYQLVRCILKSDGLKALANEKDRDGNSPLHLASKNGRPRTTYTLVRNDMVKRGTANGENLTPYEVADKQSKIVEANYLAGTIGNGKENQVDQKNDNDAVKQQRNGKLNYYGALMTLSILHIFDGRKKPKLEYLRIQGKPLPKEEIKSRIETLLVVAVLIASVTFAGVLQLPKRASDSGSEISNMTRTLNKGISEENEGILRDVYIYIDLIALNASVMASIILCWAQLYETKVAVLAVWLASILTGGAIYLMCLAFTFAVAVDVGHNVAFFVVAIVIGGGFVFIQTALSIPLIIPPSANQIIERIVTPYIYFFLFILYFSLSECLISIFSKGSKKKVELQLITSS